MHKYNRLSKNATVPSVLSLVLGLLLLNQNTFSQYTLKGVASQDNCHCYTLTAPYTFKAGAVWNNTPLDLTKSFAFTFDVYFGCVDVRGADGLVFALQTDLNSLGSFGLGQGFVGITPSIGVSLDTYQNFAYSDPVYDHLAIQINGDLNHGNPATNIAGPVPISANNVDVEDCNWHTLAIAWDATSKKYDVSFDGVPRLSIVKDLINDVFGGNIFVYWGMTGSTGAFKNLQKFCLPLGAFFTIPANQRTCAGDPIRFIDSSRGTAPITRYWDFGDGSPIDSLSINPVHSYATAGDYQVVLSVKGVENCIEQFRQTVNVIKPVADFGITNSCQQSTMLSDSSFANSAQINSWYWTLGNGTTSTLQNPAVSYSTPGSKSISLVVKSSQGCVSDTTRKTFVADPEPSPIINFNDGCKGDVVSFNGIDGSPNANLSWYWNFGDGVSAQGNPLQHSYPNAGQFSISLYAITANGCISPTVQKTLNIYSSQVNAGQDLIAAELQPVQLRAVGAAFYLWSPSAGLNNPNIADPIATLSKDQMYYLKGTDEHNCMSFDTLSIKVYKGPELYVPNAFTPNNDNLNDIFRAIPVGIVECKYFKIFNRWGRQVFSTVNFNVGWDGTYNGARQPQDVYVWIISAKDYKGNTISKKGYVTLVR